MDAIDKEVCKKLGELLSRTSILMDSGLLHAMLRTPENVQIEAVPADLRPFFRHYQFMVRHEVAVWNSRKLS